MALSRRTGQRFQASIWPGFVDAMTGLLLVLMFVLTIFMVVQFVLRETISGQETKLDALSAEVAALAAALGLEQDRNASLTERVGELTATLGDARTREEQQAALIATLQSEAETQAARIAGFEEQVAALLAARDEAIGTVATLESERDALMSEAEQLQLALAGLREEVDAQTEVARLAAARREALEALIADLRRKNAETSDDAQALREELDAAAEKLSEEEAARLAEAAAAEALRERLRNADTELTAMTLALEEERRKAEETLTLLAAAQNAEVDLSAQLSEAEKDAALLAQARASLAEQEGLTEAAQRQQALLNQQVAALRQQLSQLQGLLDEAKAKEEAADIQIETLGRDLNTALARVAAEERRRAELEKEKRERLEQYRSEFFGRVREVLGQQEGVRIVGDRFVFSSEVLFAPGEARLSPQGQREISKIATILRNVADDIPPEIDWVLQVDGHTDNVPIIQGANFADNWELSQARALSVVRFMVNFLGLPPDRLSANGFGQYQPINPADTPEARAQNRRIELKFTGK